MNRGPRLLEILLLALAAHGLGAEALDPWRGWVVFKQYAREAAEVPDPGVSVQVTVDREDETISLVFLRQEVVQEGGWLVPTGGVVCEFVFGLDQRRAMDWEVWSFEAPTFDRFVDLVEEHGTVQDLFVTRPVRSLVYWREA